ncbi:MAG: hypothetical protein IJ415_03560 [Clostridia bacterium]|nr:hypothetical protein [Clostridia bacterium]
MTRKRSKSLFVVFSIILAVCLIACFVNFTYPLSVNGNYYSYSNFVSNLKLGEDVSAGLRIVYRAEADETEAATNYNNLRTSTMNDLKEIVQAEGYKDVTVAEYGEDGIVIQIGNILTIDDKNSVVNLIGNPTAISFSSDSAKEQIFATGKDIKNVTTGSNTGENGELVYYTLVEFNDDIKALAAEKGEETVYINIGENQLEWTYGIENGMLPISLTNFSSILDATTFANQIKTGMLDLSLTQISCDEVTASYGAKAELLLTIAIVILVVAAFVFLIVRYKNLGWIACFNLLFFIVLGLFFLQSIPLVHINLAGILSMLICFILAVDSLMAMFEKAKAHYQNGTILYIAFREAQKETLFKTLFLNALILIAGFICIFMPISAVQSFGWVALVLSLVSTFTNLVLMRLFVKMYLAINNEDGKKCNFHKGGKNA